MVQKSDGLSIVLSILAISIVIILTSVIFMLNSVNIISNPNNDVNNKIITKLDKLQTELIKIKNNSENMQVELDTIESTVFPQIIMKNYTDDYVSETNIATVATSDAPFILHVCANNISTNYDYLEITKKNSTLFHFALNNTTMKCVNISGNAGGDAIMISNVNNLGGTNVIVTLFTTKEAKAKIGYP